MVVLTELEVWLDCVVVLMERFLARPGSTTRKDFKQVVAFLSQPIRAFPELFGFLTKRCALRQV